MSALLDTHNQNEENTKRRFKTALLLYKAASFFSSSRFKTLFKSEIFRFKSDPTRLFDKLRYDFTFQLNQAVDRDVILPFKNDDRSYSVPTEVYGSNLAIMLSQVAEKISKDFKISKKEKSFIVPQGEALLKAVHSHFSYSQTNNACIFLSQLDTPLNTIRTFDVRLALSAFGTFIESLNTLAYDTGHPQFEKAITPLFDDINYFVNGFPHDILVHDVLSLKNGFAHWILIRKSYCSSFAFQDGDRPELSDDYDFTLHKMY